MNPKVYIETSVVSYLTAEPSPNIVTAGRQQITREWWKRTRPAFDLYVSEFVLAEASQGDSSLSAARLEALSGIPEIEVDEEARAFAKNLVSTGPLPEKAAVDALHIAVAVCGGVDYLLTWNFKHLANASMRQAIERFCESRGYEPCVICTPEELSEE
ncbi:MAG TPA: type II toxin-antitoxin system VapC family toxin [Acidobacteriota bacterium]|nr:type II toxin-antitoxin system VapC family toxin [Acidobacteriota bacterium]